MTAVLQHTEQRLVDQRIESLIEAEAVVAQHHRRGIRGESGREPAQRTERGARVVAEQVPTPFDDRVQGAVPVGRTTIGASQQREPFFEPGGDLGDRHGPDACCGKLYGQRQAVELLAQFGDRSGLKRCGRPDGPGPAFEQFGRRAVDAAAQRGQLVNAFGGQHQWRSARGEHTQIRTGRKKIGDNGGTPADDLFTVVQDQHRVQSAHRVDGPGREITYVAPWPSACGELRFADTERRGDGADHVVVVADRCQRHIEDTAARPGQFGAHPVGDAGLADPAGPLHGHQPVSVEQRHDARDVVVTSDKFGRIRHHADGSRMPVPRSRILVPVGGHSGDPGFACAGE